MSMRVAIFGGTFDPIHNAHLAVARSAARHFSLDLVFFVPGARPPHKGRAAHAPYADRVRMVELACAGYPRFKVSRMEQYTECSYSLNTIEKFHARLSSGDELFFLIGADAFAECTTWRRWREVAAAVRFLVVSRPGHRSRPRDLRADFLNTLALPASASQIRRALAAGERPAGLPAPVLDYIAQKGLYRD